MNRSYIYCLRMHPTVVTLELDAITNKIRKLWMTLYCLLLQPLCLYDCNTGVVSRTRPLRVRILVSFPRPYFTVGGNIRVAGTRLYVYEVQRNPTHKTDHTQVTLAVQRRVEFGSTAGLSIDTIAIVYMA